jgi:hypothetical protein
MDSAQTDPTTPPRLTMQAFWHDLADGLFDLERGVPWTFWQLLRSPGRLIRDYVERRDARIVRPARWFLLGFAALALVCHLIGVADAFRNGITEGATDAEASAEQIEGILWVFSQVQWLLLISVVPAGAAALCRTYRAQLPGFAEMWVFCLYVAGQAMLLTAVALALYRVPLLNLTVLAIPLYPTVLFVAACIGYFGRVPRGRWWRPFAAMLVAMMLTGLFLAAYLFSAMSLARHLG